ncbi:tetratricopeptide repeat protein [Haloarchaeobius salinus]|uniref:tetratricopeptide repeat protein n=1 Tax=Haloarchaeobius salinus TaxID=1198298 RepID=UPI00210BF4D7|nr:tetratricopeptide repeat protein [Haloarchaeobius salinus]
MDEFPRDQRTLDVLTKRLGVLRRLCEGAAYKRDLVGELDQSRSTINRAIDDLASVDLVERTDDGFTATLAGRLALERLGAFQIDLDDIVAAEAVVDPLPFDAPLDTAAVAGSRAVPATDPAPYRPLEGFHDDLATATRYRALLPSLDDPRHVRLLYEHVATDGRPAELVVAPEVLDTLRSEFPRRMAAMAEADGFRLFVGDVPPFALALVEDEAPTDDGAPVGGYPTDPETTVHVVVFAERGGVHGTLANETHEAVRWATERYDAVRADADDRTDAFLAADATTPVVDADGGAVEGAPDTGLRNQLSVALEREGFVQLDVSYFRHEPVADPPTAWRAGLTLPEVHTGYAVARTLPDGDADMTERLLGDLTAGTDVVVVGPPGSGKSTVCKHVACEWYERDRGSVLYREGGRGRPFESVDDLAVTADIADGHTLVVVEDAVRSDADAVFDALERFADRDDVSVLLDARTAEWRDPPGDVRDPTGLSVHHMPTLGEADVERFVEGFERTTDEGVGASVDELRAEIADAPADDAGAPGEVLLLLHRLATFADPLAEGPTSLEAAVASVHESLAGDDLALDVCTLVNVLNAAGIGVPPHALYAVADPEEFDGVDAAIERLEGRVLFPRDDGSYRTVHESWSVTFLAYLLDAEGEALAAERFGDCLTALLSLADHPGRRDRIARHHDEALALPGLVDDPGDWADETAAALYALGREHPKLAPLYGGERDSVALPTACSEDVAEDRPIWVGRMFLDAGRFDDAERAFERLPADETRHAFERAFGLSRVADGRGRYDAAVAHAEECLSLAEELGDRELGGRAERRLGRALANREEYEAADPHLRRALESFDSLGDRRRAATTLDYLGSVAQSRSEYGTAREYHRRSLELSRELGDRHGEARSLANLGSVALGHTEFETARKQYERSLDIHRRLGNRDAVASVLENIGLVARHQGEYATAEEYHERSLAVSEELGDAHGEARSLGNLGLLAKKRDEYDDAVDYYERTLEIHRELGLRHGEAKACCNLAEAAVQQGDAETAREYVERANDVMEELGDRKGLAITANVLGAAHREDGAYDDACEEFRRSIELFRSVEIPQGRAVARRNLGETLAATGEVDAARDHWRTALETFEAVAVPQDALETLELLVWTCRVEDDDETALQWCERSRELLADASDAVVERHRGWVDRQLDDLDGD